MLERYRGPTAIRGLLAKVRYRVFVLQVIH